MWDFEVGLNFEQTLLLSPGLGVPTPHFGGLDLSGAPSLFDAVIFELSGNGVFGASSVASCDPSIPANDNLGGELCGHLFVNSAFDASRKCEEQEKRRRNH